MKILGIDTSTRCGSVGLVDEEEILVEHLLNLPITHSERLLSAIELALHEAGLAPADLDGWAISLGPGSFTGLRIGVSTVKGLAFATGKPVAGVSSLDVLASQVSPTPYLICPILDAKKGEVYTAFYRYADGRYPVKQSDYRAIRPENLANSIEEKTIFVGDGVKAYGDYLRESLPGLAFFPALPLNLPHGSLTAAFGLQLLRDRQFLELSSFTPLYIRPSEAELKFKG